MRLRDPRGCPKMTPMGISPNADQFAELVAHPDDGPVVMLNLLKFKAVADPPTDGGGVAGESGAEAYARYGETATRLVTERGGKIIWAGTADQILIGDPDQDWDMIALVQYPSRAAFVDMVSQPEYMEAHEDRERGVERTIVVACTPLLAALGD